MPIVSLGEVVSYRHDGGHRTDSEFENALDVRQMVRELRMQQFEIITNLRDDVTYRYHSYTISFDDAEEAITFKLKYL